MHGLQSLYDISPIFFQNIFLSCYSFYINYERYGKKFYDQYNRHISFPWLNLSEQKKYQDALLRRLITHAYQNVPYYTQIMNEFNLTPSDITRTEDLVKLPILTRDDIKINFNGLMANNLSKQEKRRLVIGHTGGTTGSPLEFYWDTATCVFNNVVDWRQKEWAGINVFDKCAVLLGRTIVPISQKTPPFWRTNYIHNTLWLSAFHMSPLNLELYVQKLKKYKPVYIEGYPSTLYVLAKFLLSNNETIPLKAAFTSSETLHSIQRETIENAFQTRLYDFYGLAERVVFATECQEHSGKHLNSDYGITEILDQNHEPVPQGQLGWITGTGLYNYAMPLIRYRTNDVSFINPEKCNCGRQFPLIDNVTTKAEDIITTPDGRYISSSVLTHPFKPLENIIESQIIQDNLNSLRVKIVKGAAYNDKDTGQLVSEMSKRLGSEIKITIEFVDRIERSANGKFRWVISKVPLRIEQ